MSSIDDVLKLVPLGEIAGQLGVSEADAEKAIRSVVPGLLGGLASNAEDADGAASLTSALGKHNGDAPSSLGAIDTDDGRKIVNHVFGDEATAASRIGGSGNADSGMVSKLLPILAPIVMSYLAKRFFGGSGSGSEQASGGSGGGLADILGGGGGGGITDILGSILGNK